MSTTVSPRLRPYLLTVGLLGIASALAAIAGHPSCLGIGQHPSVVIPLVVILVVGELFPITLSREEGDTDEVTISSTVGIALVLVAPLGIILLAQTGGLVIDEVRRWSRGVTMRGTRASRLVFNIGQYALAFLAARVVYASIGHEAILEPPAGFAPKMLPAAWLAALTFYVINSGLTSIAFGLNSSTPLQEQLRGDVMWQLGSSAMLLGLAPVYAQASLWSPWLLPFLIFPLVIVHRGAALAARRGSEALHDSLTGLPNRVMLQGTLARRLDSSAETGTALLLVDLDHFKDVNDTLGHHVGDDLIRAVGERLAGMLREGDLLARLGGDEFAVICSGLDRAATVEQAEQLALRISAAMKTPVAVDGISLHVGCSVGVAVAPEHGDGVDILLQHADVALYAAKEHRGGHAVYDPARDSHSLQRLVLAEDLRHDIQSGALEVAFQPQVHARTRVVVGVEALVRWTHPVIGSVDPERIVSLAASTGLLADLTELVLERGLTAIDEWDEAGHPMRLSVNLTARQLTDLELPPRIKGCLERHDVPPHRLILEVTESTVMSDAARSLGVVQALKDLGVELSIDDYGTGWSSLAHLQRLAPHELKVDRSFVIALTSSPPDRTIVRSTLELGHSLGLRVVAEGVEDETTAALLASWGCDVLQGFVFSIPRTAAAMTTWLTLWRDGAPPSEITIPGR